MNANEGNFRHIAYASKTDVGKRRKNNEDAIGAFPEGGLFCVADGMGGGDDGEIASAAVVKAVGDVSRRCATGAGHTAKDVATALEARLSEASSWIWKRASLKKISVCGSTFVGVVFDSTAPARALAVHAGDSRLYLVRGKKVKQITRDHSAAELMGEKDESKVNPLFRSMIVNAVGIRKAVECERTDFKVSTGDRVLICSDGLYRMVPDNMIDEISAANADVEKAVDALVAAALDGGGVDNVSVVMCEIGPLPKPVEAAPVPANPIDDPEDPFGPVDPATGETIVPTPEPEIGGVETAPAAPETKEAKRRPAWRLLLLLALALSMLAAAAVVYFSDSGNAPVVKAKPERESVQTNAAPVKAEKKNAPGPKAVSPAVTNVPVASTVTNVPPAPPAVEAPVKQPVAAKPPDKPAVAKKKDPPKQASAAKPSTAKVAEEPPPSKVEPRPCPALVSACDSRVIADFSDAIRRIAGKVESSRELDEQMRRFRESAKLCARMRSEKCVLNAVVDFKYVLTAAGTADELFEAAENNGLLRELSADWTLVMSGSEKDVKVQEACARIILNVPRLKSK